MRRTLWTLALSVLPLLLLLGGFGPDGPANAETRRIRAHLATVLEELRTTPPAGLTAAQTTARADLIGWLETYRDDGVFPHNHVLAGVRNPVFVDPHGTPCAVGYLMLRSGEMALVEEISGHANLQRVPELARDERFIEWLNLHGITVAEAGRIQPAYDYSPPGASSDSPYSEATIGTGLATAGLWAYSLSTDATEDRSAWPGVLGVATSLTHGILVLVGESNDASGWEATINVGGAIAGLGLAIRHLAPDGPEPRANTTPRVLPIVGSGPGGVTLGLQVR